MTLSRTKFKGGETATARGLQNADGQQDAGGLKMHRAAKEIKPTVLGEVAVFYIDSNEARTSENRLAREAFNFGRAERQLLRGSKGTAHSIAEADSPVKGVAKEKGKKLVCRST